MPRPNLPPTPAASTEIQGMKGTPLSPREKPFKLGPPAIAPKQASGVLPETSRPQSYRNANFALPPPPTRSRTIIQMKPKEKSSENLGKAAPTQRSPKASTKKANCGSTSASGGTKKQPSSTSVAGKKIARKTAHSVIERRRRSKMNEEFATLKDMIPACTDQEMHKLAILQVRRCANGHGATELITQKASIDYLRYLEQCITDLKAANNSLSTPLMQPQAPPPRLKTNMLDDDDNDDDEEDDEDTAMGNTTSGTNISTAYPTAQSPETFHRSPQSVTRSPAPDFKHQTSSYASSHSTLPSPAFGPQMHNQHDSQPKFAFSASTSPMFMPDPEKDQEATTALLMLNKDRRNPKGGRGMSVKDLLSF